MKAGCKTRRAQAAAARVQSREATTVPRRLPPRVICPIPRRLFYTLMKSGAFCHEWRDKQLAARRSGRAEDRVPAERARRLGDIKVNTSAAQVRGRVSDGGGRAEAAQAFSLKRSKPLYLFVTTTCFPARGAGREEEAQGRPEGRVIILHTEPP